MCWVKGLDLRTGDGEEAGGEGLSTKFEAGVPPCILYFGVKDVTAVKRVVMAVTTVSMLKSTW